ncbi:hypothetical protein NX021_26395 [Cytobacillus firmus]|nr:hypothetical protein [Cytobacillus firmus]
MKFVGSIVIGALWVMPVNWRVPSFLPSNDMVILNKGGHLIYFISYHYLSKIDTIGLENK